MNCTVTVYQDSQGRQVCVRQYNDPRVLEALRLVVDYETQKNDYLRRSHAENWSPERVRNEAERVSRLYDAMQQAARDVLDKAIEAEVITREDPIASFGPPLSLVRTEQYEVKS